MANSKSYTGTQIFLHWLIVALVFFQYIANNLVQAIWIARVAGKIPDEPVLVFHVVFGIALLFLTLWRIIQRIRDGAPKSSRVGPAYLRFFTLITHVLIYVLLIAVSVAGMAAWFFSIVWAAPLHVLLEQLLLVVIALHVASAFFQQFWVGNNVIMRMIGRV